MALSRLKERGEISHIQSQTDIFLQKIWNWVHLYTNNILSEMLCVHERDDAEYFIGENFRRDENEKKEISMERKNKAINRQGGLMDTE